MELNPVIEKSKGAKKHKRPNKFARFLKAIFVHNIGYKILSLALSVLLWIAVVII